LFAQGGAKGTRGLKFEHSPTVEEGKFVAGFVWQRRKRRQTVEQLGQVGLSDRNGRKKGIDLRGFIKQMNRTGKDPETMSWYHQQVN